jgi:hypothetical protein
MPITYCDLLGEWELFSSEAPGLVQGSEIYSFSEDHVMIHEVNDVKGKTRNIFTVRPFFNGLDLLRKDGTTFVRWNLEWHGQMLCLTNSIHSFSSLIRKIDRIKHG